MSTTADWHKEACTEASVNNDSAILANTDASQAGAHAERAVLARLDRLYVRNTHLFHYYLLLFHIHAAYIPSLHLYHSTSRPLPHVSRTHPLHTVSSWLPYLV